MRTTVDLPVGVHRRVRELATSRGLSISTVVSELTARGLNSLDSASRLEHDPVTGLSVVSIGRRISDEDVARALDDE